MTRRTHQLCRLHAPSQQGRCPWSLPPHGWTKPPTNRSPVLPLAQPLTLLLLLPRRCFSAPIPCSPGSQISCWNRYFTAQIRYFLDVFIYRTWFDQLQATSHTPATNSVQSAVPSLSLTTPRVALAHIKQLAPLHVPAVVVVILDVVPGLHDQLNCASEEVAGQDVPEALGQVAVYVCHAGDFLLDTQTRATGDLVGFHLISPAANSPSPQLILPRHLWHYLIHQ